MIMATIEYRAVLLCGEHSTCRRLYGDDPACVPEHDLSAHGARVVATFADEASATEHAQTMRAKVYGTGHEIRIDSRVVTEWRHPDDPTDQVTIPLDEDSDVVDVYAVDASTTRLQISNADGDYFAAHLAPADVLSVVEALAAHA